MTKNVTKVMSGATVGAAILGTGLNVSADTVENVPVTEPAVETQTKAVENEVTQTQVDDAKSTADQLKTDVIVQQSQTGAANNAAQTAQADVDTASQNLQNAQTVAADATDAGIAEADQNIATAQTNVDTAQAVVADANTDASQAQVNADAKQAEADEANAKADEAQTAATTAQAKVNALQNATTSTSDAEANVQKAETDVKAKQADVQKATEAVTNAKEADKAVASQVQQAQTAVNDAKTVQAQAKSAQDDAQAKANDTQKALDEAKADAAVKKPSITFNIKMSDDVKNAMKQLTNKLNVQKAGVSNIGKVFGDLIDNSPYKSNDDLKKSILGYEIEKDDTIVDKRNLTAEDKEVYRNAYYSTINALRTYLGLTPVQVSTLNEQASDYKAQEYGKKSVENGGYWYDHDRDVMRGAARQYGAGNNETLGFVTGSEQTTMTRSELQAEAANIVLSYILWDEHAEYGHAVHMLGSDFIGTSLYTNTKDDTGQTYYELIDVSSLEYKTYVRDGELKDLPEANYKRFADTVKPLPSDAEYKVALNKVVTANIANQSAQAKLATSVQNYKNATKAVQDATAKLNELQAIKSLTPEAEKTLRDAKARLAEATAKRDAAKEVLQNLQASEADKAKALKEATDAYEQAANIAAQTLAYAKLKETEANQAQKVADDAKASVVKAEEALTKAKQVLADAKSRKTALVNAEENLVKAQKAYDEAKAKSDEANKKLEVEKAKLAELKLAHSQAYAEYVRLQTLFDAQQAVKNKPKSDVKVPGDKSGNVTKPGTVTKADKPKTSVKSVKTPATVTKDEQRSKFVAPTAKVETKDVTTASVETLTVKPNELPNTGDTTSVLPLIGTAIMGALGIASVGKRRRKED